jgi:GTP-binding protein HflX
VHLAAPLHARQADAGANHTVIAELARRYAHNYDPASKTYDFIELAIAAGLQVSTTLEYTVKQINPRLYIGSGQAEEVARHAAASGVDMVVLNAPLSPVHQRNWEADLKLPVLSRYDLIFAIFEQNAHTAEGKLQVEMARLKYELPRIVRSYEQLDPLAGGIGTLGPGEQLTERIKRRHRRRIHDIEQRLDKLRSQRALRRRKRERSGVFITSIVGYTNVGKSTLLNRLTGSGVLVADQYFATLDPTARALQLPGGERMLLTDTVGFLDDLPQELVESFRATLEEMEGASLLLHLADASHSRVEDQIDAVRDIVREIGLGDTRELLVFNKIDRAGDEVLDSLRARYDNALYVSATTGHGIRELLEKLSSIKSGASVGRLH